MARGEKIIFVGGAARSGTTLLQNILDSHPDILGGPQFRNIPDIINLRNKLHESIKIRKTDMFNSCNDIDNHICTLIENLLMPLLKKHKCKLLSEKTPQNISVFPELIELFPGTHLIYIIRDPRAVIASNMLTRVRFKEKGILNKKGKNVKFTGGKLSDFIGLINWVKRDYLAGISSTKIAPARVLTVVYERLVANPESETKKICNFLGIEWSSQMLHPASKSHLGEEPMTRTGVWYTQKSYNKDIDITCIDKWEKQLTYFQKFIILYYFREIEDLAYYGYALSANTFTQKALLAIFSYLKQICDKLRIIRLLLYPVRNLKTFTAYNDNTHVP